MVYYRVLNIVCCAMRQKLIAYPFYNSSHLLIPSSQSFPSSPPPPARQAQVCGLQP